MVVPSKPTKRIRSGRRIVLVLLVVLSLTTILILFLFQQQQQQQQQHKAAPSKLPLWQEAPFATFSAIPTGSYQYHHQGSVYFPHADLSVLIQPDDLLSQNDNGQQQQKTSSSSSSSSLVSNYSEYKNGDIALLTRCGYKGHDAPNQDRIVLLDTGGVTTKMMALFDGHGTKGHGVAHAAAMGFLKLISSQQQQSQQSSQQQSQSHLKKKKDNNNNNKSLLTSAMLTNMFLQVDKSLPDALGSGATAIVIVQQEQNELLVANLGDSQAFVAEYDTTTNKITIVYQTKKHKPHYPAEKMRIEQAGGRIIHNPGESSRVIIPLGGTGGQYAGMELGLAMSRSLGDNEGKTAGVLTATPTINVVKLDSRKQSFVVAATDGIFDYIDLDTVAQYLGMVLYNNNDDETNNNNIRLLDACEQLILRASQEWKDRTNSLYRDDISIMVSKL